MSESNRLNRIYWGMIDRCYNANNNNYKRYGERGITVCEEWQNRKIIHSPATEGWLAFQKWALENGYQDNLSIDRIDVNKGYSPDNCRWATEKEQQNNRRDNHLVTYKNKTQTLTQWCEELSLDYDKTQRRLNTLHWGVEKAFEIKEDMRVRKKITHNGETYSLADWCKKLNLNYKTVYARITKHHWTVEKALFKE